jgi:plastocyanin
MNLAPMLLLLPTLLTLAPLGASAADASAQVSIRNHVFEPAEVRVPAGKVVKLTVRNEDATPEEFESHELNREKLIKPRSSVTFPVGPLKPGRYPFVGEFNAKTARGVLIAE